MNISAKEKTVIHICYGQTKAKTDKHLCKAFRHISFSVYKGLVSERVRVFQAREIEQSAFISDWFTSATDLAQCLNIQILSPCLRCVPAHTIRFYSSLCHLRMSVSLSFASVTARFLLTQNIVVFLMDSLRDFTRRDSQRIKYYKEKYITVGISYIFMNDTFLTYKY